MVLELAALVPAHIGDVHTYQWLLLALIVGGPFLVIGVLVRLRRAEGPAAEAAADPGAPRGTADPPHDLR